MNVPLGLVRTHAVILCAITAAAFLPVGCGGGPAATPAPLANAPAISVSVSPPSATVQIGQGQTFTATVANDAKNMGVTWALTGAGCSGGS
jgi:hypothetical protein